MTAPKTPGSSGLVAYKLERISRAAATARSEPAAAKARNYRRLRAAELPPQPKNRADKER
jgi:hypothetical protein